MRIRPTPAIGVAIGILYAVSFIGLAGVGGGVITDLTSADRIRPFVVSLAVTAGWLIAVTTWLGWWTPVLREERRLGGVLRTVPVVWAIVIGVVLIGGRGWTLPVDRLVMTVVLGLLVGFSEELAYRGLVLVGLRGGLREGRAFLVSTVLFALLHLPNAMLGAPLAGAVVQVVLAFLGGAALYTIRRTAGLLVAAMLFHAGWDIAVFLNQDPAIGIFPVLANVVLVVLIVARRGELFAGTR